MIFPSNRVRIMVATKPTLRDPLGYLALKAGVTI